MDVLGKLFQFTTMTELNVKKCPVDVDCSSFEVILADVLRKSTKITRFNKIDVTESHKLESIWLAQYKYEKEQAELKAQAAADAAKEGGEDNE